MECPISRSHSPWRITHDGRRTCLEKRPTAFKINAAHAILRTPRRHVKGACHTHKCTRRTSLRLSFIFHARVLFLLLPHTHTSEWTKACVSPPRSPPPTSERRLSEPSEDRRRRRRPPPLPLSSEEREDERQRLEEREREMADVVVVVARLWRGEGGGGGTSSADSLSTARPREGREERALPSGGGGRRRRESSSGRWYYYYNSKGEGGGGGPRPAQHPRHPPLTSAEDRERDRGNLGGRPPSLQRGSDCQAASIHSVFPFSPTDPMAVWRGGGGDDDRV